MMITRHIVSSLSSGDGGSPAHYGHWALVPRSGGQVTIYHNNISQEKSFVPPTSHQQWWSQETVCKWPPPPRNPQQIWSSRLKGEQRWEMAGREKPIGHDECWIIQSNETHFHRLMSKHVNNNMVPGHADAAGEGGTLSGCQVRAAERWHANVYQ